MQSPHECVPAAGRDWALPLYDPLISSTGLTASYRSLVQQAHVCEGERVLDVGCGTGTLAIAIKRQVPGAEVTGIDPDPRALNRARAKSERASATIRFQRALADSLPFGEAAFEQVFCSFVLHHLSPVTKAAALREIARVLTPGGKLHLVDFAQLDLSLHNLLARLVSSKAGTAPAVQDDLLPLIARAGLAGQMTARRLTILGTTQQYVASKP